MPFPCKAEVMIRFQIEITVLSRIHLSKINFSVAFEIGYSYVVTCIMPTDYVNPKALEFNW